MGDPIRPPDGVRVVEALYALAVDPEGWGDFIDVLARAEDAGPDTGSLKRLAEGAGRVARSAPREPPATPPPVAVGVLTVSRVGRLIDCNAMAEPLLGALGFEATLSGRRLTRMANLDALARARRRVCGRKPARAIIKLLEQGDRERFAYVIAARDLPAELRAGPMIDEEGAVAVILPIVGFDAPFWAGLADSFSLTAAEIRLADRLRGGQTLKEAAAELRLSVNTVRNQLTSIFEKLGVRRQSDLVWTLNSMAGVFAALPPTAAQGPAIVATDAGALFDAPPVREVVLGDGRRMAYRAYGDPEGQPTLFCHGGLGASLLPRGADDFCRELGLWMICPERAGIGRSDPAPDVTLAQSGRDLADLADRLGVGNLQIWTLTSGGRFGLAAAEALGSRVRRVLMLSPRMPSDEDAAGARGSPMVRFQTYAARHPWVIGALMEIMRHRLTRPIFERITLASAVSPGDAAYLSANPALIDLMLEAMRETWLNGSAGTSAELRCLALEGPPRPERISAAIEIWHGAEDSYGRPDVVAAYYGVDPRQVRVFPDIGNYLLHKHWIEALATLAGNRFVPEAAPGRTDQSV